MAVRIRLARRGRKKLAIYDVVVADSRSPRDGRFIEKLGTYNPNTNPSSVELNDDKAFNWLMVGALPTDTVRNILSERGIMLKKHLQVGVNKGAITQEEADKKFQKWLSEKEEKLKKQVESMAKSKSAKDKARLEAEIKIKEKRAEELRKKQAELAGTVAEAEAENEEVSDTAEENVAPESGEKLNAEEASEVAEAAAPSTSEDVAPESGEKAQEEEEENK